MEFTKEMILPQYILMVVWFFFLLLVELIMLFKLFNIKSLSLSALIFYCCHRLSSLHNAHLLSCNSIGQKPITYAKIKVSARLHFILHVLMEGLFPPMGRIGFLDNSGYWQNSVPWFRIYFPIFFLQVIWWWLFSVSRDHTHSLAPVSSSSFSKPLTTSKVHRLDGHEFEWTPGVGDGHGGLVCCNSWGRKESDTTERLTWTESSLTSHVSETAKDGSLL